MDGLLIDSETVHKKAEYQLLEYLGCAHLEELCHNTYGMKTEDALNFLRRHANFSHSDEEATAYWLKVITEDFKKVELMPGAGECLNNLSQAGFRLGLCSSSPWELINIALDNLQIRSFFHALTSGDEVGVGKPEPDIYLHCARELDVNPRMCLAAEDAPKGVEAAKRAGMKCLAVPNLHTRNFDFAHADGILNSLKELTPELIRQL